MRLWIALLIVGAAAPARAETVDVRGRGPLDLKHFICEPIERSFIRRVCHDQVNRYMVVQFGSTYSHYCDVGPDVAYELVQAESPSRFFNQVVRGRYGCQGAYVPMYQ